VHRNIRWERENIGDFARLYDCLKPESRQMMGMMFSTAIQDLAKPQWLAALSALKRSGSMPIAQLAEHLGVSYMAAKQYGEDLTRLGYLERIRTPRTAVGRPEIFYRIAAKADTLFPDIGMALSLELLENSRHLFGENAPERLIYQHFESLRVRWSAEIEPSSDPRERAQKLAALRTASGAMCFFEPSKAPCARLIELHHPLSRLFQKYPRATGMDTRMIEDLLGLRVERVERIKGGKESVMVEFLLPELPAEALD